MTVHVNSRYASAHRLPARPDDVPTTSRSDGHPCVTALKPAIAGVVERKGTGVNAIVEGDAAAKQSPMQNHKRIGTVDVTREDG